MRILSTDLIHWLKGGFLTEKFSQDLWGSLLQNEVRSNCLALRFYLYASLYAHGTMLQGRANFFMDDTSVLFKTRLMSRFKT